MKLEKVITALKSYVRGNKNGRYNFNPIKGDVVIFNGRVSIAIEHGSREIHIELPLEKAEGISKHFTFNQYTCGNEWNAKLENAETVSELPSVVYPEGESAVISGSKIAKFSGLVKSLLNGSEIVFDRVRNAFLIDSAEGRLRFVNTNGAEVALESFSADVLPKETYSINYLANLLLNAIIEKKAEYRIAFSQNTVTFFSQEKGQLFRYQDKGTYSNNRNLNAFVTYDLPSGREIDGNSIGRILTCIGEADEAEPSKFNPPMCCFTVNKRTLCIRKETRQNSYELAAYESVELQGREGKKLSKLSSYYNIKLLKPYVEYLKQAGTDSKYHIGFLGDNPEQTRIVLYTENSYCTLMPLCVPYR